MTMRYFVAADYSGYYAAEEPSEITDIEVTERPHPVCVWDGAAWVYDLDLARAYQYEKILSAQRADFDAALTSNRLNEVSVMAAIGMALDRTSYGEDTGRSVDTIPFMKGYGLQLSYSMAQVATDVDSFFLAVGVYLGKSLAQRMRLCGQVAFETDAETVLTYNWVTIT